MYCHSFLMTCVRGNALLPTTAASEALGVNGAMKALFGFRFLPLRVPFFAVRFALFFVVFFFFFLAIIPPTVVKSDLEKTMLLSKSPHNTGGKRKTKR